ncbi:hypothetical protein ACTOB_004824 [Actinoplanes oblitus]|uniref:Uncharacterized protein n=1 Tax=Actinoplanes oblitus TaxID=3040509 RepID=A0ABY8W6T4_9ACTN|nr:hypothetical protein [Actinoplanes oblitus]WIM92866.1 hypothetical protein ACTOB_004824 [Actinoplanes oblitus]
MAGRTRVRPVTGRVRPIEHALTEVARLDEAPSPIFAAPGGRRRPRHWWYAAGMLLPLWPLWSLPLQQIAYRQFLYLVLLRAALTALTGRGLRWQKLRRTGGVVVPARSG